jgi:hypothetical protein
METTIHAEIPCRFEDGEEGQLFGILTFGVQELKMLWEGEKAEDIRRILESEEAQAFVTEFMEHMSKEWLRVKGLTKGVRIGEVSAVPVLPEPQGNA